MHRTYNGKYKCGDFPSGPRGIKIKGPFYNSQDSLGSVLLLNDAKRWHGTEGLNYLC